MRYLTPAIILLSLMPPPNTYAKEITLLGCDFIVGMPSNVKVENITSKHFSFEQAKSFVGDVVLQAECLPYSAQENEIKKMALDHAQGVGGYGAHIRRIDPRRYESRFYKNIEGVGTATFLTHIHVGPRSTLVAVGGVASTKFPNDEILRFHKSIKPR